jgi:hypothetical protein
LRKQPLDEAGDRREEPRGTLGRAPEDLPRINNAGEEVHDGIDRRSSPYPPLAKAPPEESYEGLSQLGDRDRVSSSEAPASPSATVAALEMCGPEEERVMTNTTHPIGSARAALRDAVLALGGVIAIRQPGDELVEAIACALGAVVRRHLGSDSHQPETTSSASRLRPHPAIVELLDQIGRAQPVAKVPVGLTTPVFGDDEWQRLPGLFRRWEIEQVLDEDHDIHIEAAGSCEDGTSLFAAYARSHEPRRDDR